MHRAVDAQRELLGYVVQGPSPCGSHFPMRASASLRMSDRRLADVARLHELAERDHLILDPDQFSIGIENRIDDAGLQPSS